ncbi:MAG: DNA polymerase III subunit delta' [Aquificae bacterium]|nr:DNA polymerase III subunit delta' [Aquificota bacterium]
MQVIGHQKEKELLSKYLNKNQSSYSFLFEGKEGIGKKLLALYTARGFLCEKERNFGCGECENCRLTDDLISNIYEGTNLSPNPNIKLITSENGRDIKISQIRDAIDFLKLKSKEGKVIIIENAEKMNTEASNALLKTLEEPPENSMIILTTTNQNKLLPTIISRCYKIRFNPLPKEEIYQFLLHKDFSESDAKTFSVLSDGSLSLYSAVKENPKIYQFAKDLALLFLDKNLRIEGIINLADILDKLDNKDLSIVLQIVQTILHKKMLKGEFDIDLYDRLLKEYQEFEKAIKAGVKKKLAVEGMYFNVKGG